MSLKLFLFSCSPTLFLSKICFIWWLLPLQWMLGFLLFSSLLYSSSCTKTQWYLENNINMHILIPKIYASHLTFLFILAVWHVEFLVPQPGMEPVPLEVEAWSLSHWTPREVTSYPTWPRDSIPVTQGTDLGVVSESAFTLLPSATPPLHLLIQNSLVYFLLPLRCPRVLIISFQDHL